MSAGKTTRALCVCDGAAVPTELAAQSWDHRIEITTRGQDPEINFVVERLVGKLSGRLDPRVQDVLSLAAYCFAADRLVRRGGAIDINREGWRRELDLCVPVADPAFWSRPEVTRRLTDALNFATDDQWSFRFDAVDRTAPQLEITWDDRELLDQPDTVVLFSGGTDSLCGLVDAVKRGAKPVLVGHWAADHVKSRQQRLRAAVRRAFGPWEYPFVQVELHRRGTHDGESSQRTRGFLFACLGAAIAAHLRVKTVLLPENGYVSINPRINDQLVGALASRGTHPKFVFLFNRLLDVVFGGTVEVVNPLWDKTRAEALRLLADAGGAKLLAQTFSCGKLQGRPVGKPHCGGCSQCVDRRFAVIGAGLAAHDPVERYEVDVFGRSIPEGEARTVALSYLRFAEEIVPLDAEAILDRRRELDHCVDPDDPDFDTRGLQLADLLKRHAAEVRTVMMTMYQHHARGLADRTVEPESLLLLWQALPSPTSPDAQAGSDTGLREGQAGDVSRFGVQPRTTPSVFVRSGEVWIVEFRDEKGGLRDRVGARRLARILKAGGADLEALDLVAESGAPSASRKGKQGSSNAPRTSRPGDAGTVLTLDDIKTYRAAREELDRAIKVEQVASNAKRAAELQRERDWIDAQLRAWVGKGDKPRAFPGEHERARQTVSKTVWDEVRKLRKTMPLLAAHLETFVHLGYLCWYAPDPPEPWDIKL